MREGGASAPRHQKDRWGGRPSGREATVSGDYPRAEGPNADAPCVPLYPEASLILGALPTDGRSIQGGSDQPVRQRGGKLSSSAPLSKHDSRQRGGKLGTGALAEPRPLRVVLVKIQPSDSGQLLEVVEDPWLGLLYRRSEVGDDQGDRTAPKLGEDAAPERVSGSLNPAGCTSTCGSPKHARLPDRLNPAEHFSQ